jgi:transposase
MVLHRRQHKQDTLRFLHDAAAPFTNNQAERDGRMMKVKMKISGGFHYQDGADDFAIIRSFISTAKKRAWNVIHALA